MNLKLIIDFALSRLNQKSTWIAIVTAVATLTGMTIAPEVKDAIGGVGMAIVTVALAVMNESARPSSNA